MRLRYWCRIVLGVALTVSGAGFARAQCPYPPCSPTNPGVSLGSAPKSYGHGAAIGAGVGIAVGVAAIALYVHHKHSMQNKAAHPSASIVGCTQVANNGVTLLDEKDKKVYSLVAAGMDLKSGERVELTGNETVDRAGKRIFTAETLSRNLGFCGGAETTLNLAPVAQQ
jgi:hypothetical protein